MNTSKIKAIVRHLWQDESDARRAIPPAMLQRLAGRVAASERLHTGQVRIYVEAALPLSYLSRLGKSASLTDIIRQRAVMLFGKLQVWDTAQNNGVLIYLLLAEHAIEIVADRGLAFNVPSDQWQALIARMGSTFRQQRFEGGLDEALDEVSNLLISHFPALPHGAARTNELPDEPLLG